MSITREQILAQLEKFTREKDPKAILTAMAKTTNGRAVLDAPLVDALKQLTIGDLIGLAVSND